MDLSSPRQAPEVGSCDHGNEQAGFIKWREFFLPAQ